MTTVWLQEKIRQYLQSEEINFPVTAILEVEIQLLGPVGDQTARNIQKRTILDTIHQGLTNFTLHLTDPPKTVAVTWESQTRESTRFITRSHHADFILRKFITQFFRQFEDNRDYRIHYVLSKPIDP